MEKNKELLKLEEELHYTKENLKDLTKENNILKLQLQFIYYNLYKNSKSLNNINISNKSFNDKSIDKNEKSNEEKNKLILYNENVEKNFKIYLDIILQNNKNDITPKNFYLFMKYLILKLLYNFYLFDDSIIRLFFNIEYDKNKKIISKGETDLLQKIKKIIKRINDDYSGVELKTINMIKDNYFYITYDGQGNYTINSIKRVCNMIYFMKLYNKIIYYVLYLLNIKNDKNYIIESDIINKLIDVYNKTNITNKIEPKFLGGKIKDRESKYYNKYLKYKIKYEQLKKNKI